MHSNQVTSKHQEYLSPSTPTDKRAPSGKLKSSVFVFQDSQAKPVSAPVSDAVSISQPVGTAQQTSNRPKYDNSLADPKFEANVDRLVRNLSDEDKTKVRELIKQLSPEVYKDLINEIDEICVGNIYADRGGRSMGRYSPNAERLLIDLTQPDQLNTMIHEIGHAVDFSSKWTNLNESFMNKDAFAVYRKEMANYEKAGGKVFGKEGAPYFTKSHQELFAEVYMWMHSDSPNKEEMALAEKYFPETVKMIRQHIEATRKLPVSTRKTVTTTHAQVAEDGSKTYTTKDIDGNTTTTQRFRSGADIKEKRTTVRYNGEQFVVIVDKDGKEKYVEVPEKKEEPSMWDKFLDFIGLG